MATQTNALTTLARVKAWLEIDPLDTSKDLRLELLIDAVSAAVESRAGRTFGLADPVTEHVRPSGTQRLLLSHYPIARLDTVEIDGLELAAGDAVIEDAAAGILFRASGWPASDQLWAGASGDSIAGTGSSSIAVTYAGGYSLPGSGDDFTLPRDLEAAVLVAVASNLSADRNARVRSKAIGDASITFEASPGAAVDLPSGVVAVIDRYGRGNL